ncbi:hypothetical protein [Nocardioides sp.]|uniref:hypothetical protein n=1 Tax=Nocardioides sp. TaxID=35761 RepID=UPI00271E1D2D|nr:hypothetical protein [Nocardioides sp.]MDO9456747.1 hypothetical protein [Nocardioides sp.]
MTLRPPSLATCLALLALVVALGGTSYAVSQLPPKSVGTPQLKNNAVTSAKVKNGSLRTQDFKKSDAPRGPRGAAGPVGPAGPQGDRGPSNGLVFTRSNPRSLPGTAATTVLTVTPGTPAVATYVATASADTGQDVAGDVRCQLKSGAAVLDDVTVRVAAVGSPGDEVRVVLVGGVSGGAIDIVCADGSGLDFSIDDQRLAAVRVDAVTKIDL